MGQALTPANESGATPSPNQIGFGSLVIVINLAVLGLDGSRCAILRVKGRVQGSTRGGTAGPKAMTTLLGNIRKKSHYAVRTGGPVIPTRTRI